MIPPSSSGKTSAASVVARLRNIARERGMSVEAARDHFAREAFLRRLVASPFAGDFVLKGSVLLLAWFREFHRPTMDADFLVRKPMSSDDLRAALTTIITISQDDLVLFDAHSLRMEAMQEDRTMVGYRVSIAGGLGSGSLLFRADIGFSDVVTPQPGMVSLDGLMAGSITLLGSTVVTVIAEKYDAMVDRGAFNTRMKDYFDLATLARRQAFSGHELTRAIRATFANRGRKMPTQWDERLDALPGDACQQRLWATFLKEIGKTNFGTLEQVIAEIRVMLEEPLRHVEPEHQFVKAWRPGVGWE
jgi:hypothetical protein